MPRCRMKHQRSRRAGEARAWALGSKPNPARCGQLVQAWQPRQAQGWHLAAVCRLPGGAGQRAARRRPAHLPDASAVAEQPLLAAGAEPAPAAGGSGAAAAAVRARGSSAPGWRLAAAAAAGCGPAAAAVWSGYAACFRAPQQLQLAAPAAPGQQALAAERQSGRPLGLDGRCAACSSRGSSAACSFLVPLAQAAAREVSHAWTLDLHRAEHCNVHCRRSLSRSKPFPPP